MVLKIIVWKSHPITAKKHAHIQIIDQPNQGVGATRNNGLDMATGKYVYFLDPDDYICSNILNTLLGFIEKNSLEILCLNPSLPWIMVLKSRIQK